MKTLPLVSWRDEPNLGEEGQACARWTGCPKATDVSLTLENTHLSPSPLCIRWSSPDYGPSPGTKQSALEMFHGLSVHGRHTHTHVFVCGPVFSGLEKSTPEVKFQLLGQSRCHASVPSLFMGSRKVPAHLLPVGHPSIRTAGRE